MMRGNRTRILLAAIGAAALIAGVVVAASGPASHSHSHSSAGDTASADLAAAARYLGLDPAKLRLELRQGQTLAAIAQATQGHSVNGLAAVLAETKAARVRAAVKAGKLSETAGRAQLATVTERARAEVGRHRPTVGLGGSLIPAAKYLGMSRAELLRQVRAGQTLARIAGEHKGHSASGLIDALVAGRGAKITAAVRAGALSPSEGIELRATLRRRMSALVERGSARNG